MRETGWGERQREREGKKDGKMDEWMDLWREGGTPLIKFLTNPLTFLFPFLLLYQCLSYSTLFSHPPCALQVEWVKEFRSETYSLSPHLLFWVWVPLSGIMAHSFLDPPHSTCPLRTAQETLLL